MNDRQTRPQVGQIWRTAEGGHPQYVVAVDDRFAYVKRGDSGKKRLANRLGSYPVALSEFGQWTLLSEVAAMQEP